MSNIMYRATFVHPIAGECPDATCDVELPEALPTDIKTLGKVLRSAGVLTRGVRVREARAHGGNRLVVFPSRQPGGWHSITLKPVWAYEAEAQTRTKGTQAMTAEQLIYASVHANQRVHAEYTDALYEDLLAACDPNCDTSPFSLGPDHTRTGIDLWGDTDSGYPWSVRLVQP